MSQNFDFDCDPDLEPLIKTGLMNEWQAMSLTTYRQVRELQKRLAAVEKKMAEPDQSGKVSLTPRFGS